MSPDTPGTDSVTELDDAQRGVERRGRGARAGCRSALGTQGRRRAVDGGVSLLEREGDIAADYLEVLLDIADLDGDIDIDVEGDRAAVSVVGPGLDRLIGNGGATLDALQELTRLAVHRETGVRSRLMLDVGGHRARGARSSPSSARPRLPGSPRPARPSGWRR